MMKNYLLRVLEQCSEEQFGQDAIEWAIVTGFVDLSYNLEKDANGIMSRYDEIIDAYRRSGLRGTEEHRKAMAPMRRAVPRNRAKAGASEDPGKRRSVG